MRRRLLAALVLPAVAVAAVLILAQSPASAGSPHFVGTPTVTRSDDSLTVTGKEAGLGNEAQVHVVLTADVACVNPGSNEPKAENKGATVSEGDFPVQNGKADFTLTGTGVTDPSCTPPMTLRYSNVVVTDTTNDISVTVPGVF
jgi:hypothetical protein